MPLLSAPASFEVNGQRLTILEIRGVLYFIAKEVGHFLGYGDDGRQLISLVGDEWKEEMQEGKHRLLLDGEQLAVVKRMIDASGNTGRVDRRNSLLLLTEPGLWRVLILTGKPAGIALRDKLDSEILPQIRKTGAYSLPTAPPRVETDVAGWVRALPEELASMPAGPVLELMLAEMACGCELPTYRKLLSQLPTNGHRGKQVPEEKRREILSWWAERADMPSSEVARHWGVTATAVRTWKMRVRAGVR